MMAANKYQSSKETTNFARICRVVIDVIPDLLRDLLITRLPVSGLSAELTNQKRQMLTVLKNSKYQMNILYPQGGVYQGSVKDLDTSLLYILLRNIGNIPAHQNGWGKEPDIADRSLSANIDRLRIQRNESFAHAPNASLSDGDFQVKWAIIRQSVEEIQNGELKTGLFVVAMDAILTTEMDDRMTNKYIVDFVDLLLAMKGKMETVQNEVGDVRVEVRTVGDEVGAVRDEVIAVKEKLTTMSANLDKDDVSAITDDVSTVKDDVNTVKDDVSTVKEDISTVKDDVSTVKDDVNTVKDDVSAVKDDVGTVKDDVGTVKDDVGTVKDDVGTLKDDVGTVKDDVGTLKDDVGTLKEDVGTVKDDVGTVKDDVGTVKDDVGTVKDDVGTVKEDVCAVKEDVGTVKDDVGTVKEDVGTVKDDVGTVKDDVSTIKEDVCAVKEDVSTVKEDVSTVKDDVSTIKEDVSTVKDDISTVKDDVSTVKEDVGTVKEDVGTVKDDVSIVKDDVSTVKDDVCAVKEDVSTVKFDVGTVRADVSSMKDTLTTLSTGTRHVTDGDRKLTAMIETTTAVILREKDEYEFICTKSLQDAFAKLKQNGLVIIKGNSGDGKTSIALELLWRLCYNEEGQQLRLPLELHDVKDLDSVAPKSKLVIYFDDVFGKNVVCKQDVKEWEKKEKSIIAKFSGNENTGGNFLIIAIRSGISNSLTGSSLEKLFTAQNTVDVNIDAEEKLEFLRLYQPKDKFVSWKESEEKEIVKCAPDIGFPQCCRLFRDSASLQSERVNFFRRPFHFLKSSLSKLEDGKCYGLMYLFLNGGEVMEEDLDSGSENIDQNVLEAAFAKDVVRVTPTTELVYNKGRKIEFVKESLDCLLGWMVKKEQKQKVCYKFSHDSIEETLALLYGEKTPIGFIKKCPSKFLSCVTTSKTTPNKVVISSSNEHMYKRLLREFESVYCRFNSEYSDYHSITSLDVWTDVQFLQGFIRWLSGQNVDKHVHLCHVIKLALLNRACYSGSEECALCLLSEGVEPDVETPFCVVKGGSVSLLRKLLKYKVTLTARAEGSLSSHYAGNITVLQEACLCDREEMVTVLYNTDPHLVHDTDRFGRSTLHLVAQTGNCDIFKTVERFILKSLCRVEDEQHKCERVEGGVVHRNCVCAQYMSGLVDGWLGWTVLHYSCSGGHRELSRYLCETYPTLATAVDNDGRTVLHRSCMFGHREVSRYLFETYPTLTTAVDVYGRHCLHHIAGSWSRRSDLLDMFTECETHVKQYLESTGRKYDITTILTNQGESVLDIAKERKERRARRGRENEPLYDHLVQLFGQDKH